MFWNIILGNRNIVLTNIATQQISLLTVVQRLLAETGNEEDTKKNLGAAIFHGALVLPGSMVISIAFQFHCSC